MDEVKDNPGDTSSVENTGSWATWADGEFRVDRSKLNSPDIGWFKRWLLNRKICNVERVVNSSDVNADSAFRETIVDAVKVAICSFCNSPVIQNPWTIFGAIRYANTLFERTESTIRKKQTQFGENAQKFFEKYQNLSDEIKSNLQSNLPIELRNILRNNGKGLLSNDQLKKAEKIVATMQGILENKWRRHSKAGNSWLQQVQLTRCLNRRGDFSQEEIKRVEENLINALNENAGNEIFYEEVEKKDTTVSSNGIDKEKIQLSQKPEIKFEKELKFYFGEPYLAINIKNDNQQETVYVKLEDTFCGVERQNEKDVIIFSIPLTHDEKFDVLTREGKQIEYLTYTISPSDELKDSLVETNLLDLSQDDLHQNTLSKFKIKLDDAAAIGDPQKQNDTPFIYAPGPGAKRATKPKYDYGEVENFLQKNDALPDPSIKRFYIRSSDGETKFSLYFNNGSLDSVRILRLNNGKLDVSGWLTKIAILNNNDNSDTVTFQCKYRSGGEERTEEITVKKENLLQCKRGKQDATDNPPLDVYLTRNGWFPAKDGNLILKSADGQIRIKITNSIWNPVSVSEKDGECTDTSQSFRACNVVVSNVKNDGKQVRLSFKPALDDRGQKIRPDQEKQDIIFDISELENLGKSDKN
ncbi:MAG: hypothetical protein K2L13_03025 [Opitutales bacterium]|nr:hypothetical protein [Opitutales bacterium]